jgi:hypothetical protein
MASSIDTAKDLLTFVGGPSALGTAALLAYTKKIFEGRDRRPGPGWTALVAGLALIVWMIVFVVWAAPTVFRSWAADGSPDVTLVLLSVTWFLAVSLVGLMLLRSPVAGRYLIEAYREGDGPWLVRRFGGCWRRRE